MEFTQTFPFFRFSNVIVHFVTGFLTGAYSLQVTVSYLWSSFKEFSKRLLQPTASNNNKVICPFHSAKVCHAWQVFKLYLLQNFWEFGNKC